MHIKWLLRYPITGSVFLQRQEEMAIVQCCTNHVRGLMRCCTELRVVVRWNLCNTELCQRHALCDECEAIFSMILSGYEQHWQAIGSDIPLIEQLR